MTREALRIAALSTYIPVWRDAAGLPVLGPDEDVLTLAVAAALPLLSNESRQPEHSEHQPTETGHNASRAGVRTVVLITDWPDYLQGTLPAVLARALDLPSDCSIQERLGRGPDALEAMSSAAAGTLIIAVNAHRPSAAAALIGDAGGGQENSGARKAGRYLRSVPITVRSRDQSFYYEDPRFLREQGWTPALRALAPENGTPVAVTGIPAKVAKSAGGFAAVVGDRSDTGPAEPLLALAELAKSDGDQAVGTVRLIAMDAGHGAAIDVDASFQPVVHRTGRAPLPAPKAGFAPKSLAKIPISLPAYNRAFDEKVGFTAARNSLGELERPYRTAFNSAPEALPRRAQVYSVVTVRVPIPGLPGPYSLVLTDLPETGLRVLAKVTDVPAGSAAIGSWGAFVLRRTAVRDGIPDYDYAFQPDEVQPEAVKPEDMKSDEKQSVELQTGGAVLAGVGKTP